MQSIGILIAALLLVTFITSTSRANEIIDLPNYSFKYSAQTTASKSDIWAIWTDVENWKKFDERLLYSYLENEQPFTVGATGYLKGKGAPSRTKFELAKVNAPHSFTETLKLPFYQSIELQRYFEKDQNGQTVFTHQVNFKGRLAPITYALLCGAFKKDLKLVVRKLKDLAEK